VCCVYTETHFDDIQLRLRFLVNLDGDTEKLLPRVGIHRNQWRVDVTLERVESIYFK
jgi:hypothetical protein